MSFRWNGEHYYDPTAGSDADCDQALENIAREERRKEQKQSDAQPSDQKTARLRYVNKPRGRRN